VATKKKPAIEESHLGEQLSLFTDDEDEPVAVFESALSTANAFGCCARFRECSAMGVCQRTDIGASCMYNDNLRRGERFLIDG
jgi:hypothetical protein